MLRHRDAKLYLLCGDVYGVQFPTREKIGPEDDETKKFAETVERVAARKVEDHERLLQEAAVSPVSGVSNWGITVLATSRLEGSVAFLESLIGNEAVPLSGQAALDQQFLRLKGKEWQESPRRWNLVQRWVKGKHSLRDSHLVIDQLDRFAQHPDSRGFSAVRLVELVRTAVSNERMALDARKRGCDVLELCAKKHKRFSDDRPAYEFALQLLKTAKEPELRRSAARLLVILSLSNGADRRKTVVELRKSEADAEVVRWFQFVIDEPVP